MSQSLGCRSLALVAALWCTLPMHAAEPEPAAPATPAPAPEPIAPVPQAAAPAPKPVVIVPQVPGNSFVTMSDALRAEVFNKLRSIAKEKHSCNKLQVVDTRTRSVRGKVRLGNDGQLLDGTITELWKVDFCGTKTGFSLVLTPPVEGASGVALTERD